MIDCVFHKNKFSMKCNALSYRYEYKIATKFYKERYQPNIQTAKQSNRCHTDIKRHRLPEWMHLPESLLLAEITW